MQRYPTTPLWLKLTVPVLLLAAAASWVLNRTDRTDNERGLSAIASQTAGRPVEVHRRATGARWRGHGWPSQPTASSSPASGGASTCGPGGP